MVSTLRGLTQPKESGFHPNATTILFISGDGNSMLPGAHIKIFTITFPPSFFHDLGLSALLPNNVWIQNTSCRCTPPQPLSPLQDCDHGLLSSLLQVFASSPSASAFSTLQPGQAFRPVHCPCPSSAQNHPGASLPIQSKRPSLSWTLLLLQLRLRLRVIFRTVNDMERCPQRRCPL